MKVTTVRDAQLSLRDLVDGIEDGPVIITEDDQPVAALVRIIDDGDLEDQAWAESTRLRRILDEAEEEYRRTGGMTHEEFWRAVEERYGRDDEAEAEK
jgi:antitoxin (DNA-binding transcriptional repressor) of toxin-antitoxin stability system